MSSKLSDLTAILGSQLASGDLFYVVDVSAGASGSKKITRDELFTGMAPITNLQLNDSVTLTFGTGNDVTVTWDGTNLIVAAAADDSLIEIGDSAATQKSFDLKWYGNSANGADFLYFDASANLVYTTGIDIQFLDNDFLVFGTGAGATGDVNISWNATFLAVLCTADDSIIKFGNGTNDFDLWWYTSDANHYVSIDASADRVKFEDSVILAFGTGAGAGPGTAGDVAITWDATDLKITAAVDDSVIEFGNGTQSFDLKIFGNTASDFILFDASASELIFTAATFLSGQKTRIVIIGTNTTVDATHSGKVIAVTSGAGITVTLPTMAAGFNGVDVTIINAVGQNLTISAQTAGQLVVLNDLAANSVALSTASEKIGGAFRCIGDSTTGLWYVLPLLWPDVGGAAQTATVTT